MLDPAAAQALDGRLAPLDLPARLAAIHDAADGPVVLTTAFGREGAALVHAVAASGLEIEIATVDTGRLFGETHTAWAELEERYRIRIRALAPEAAEVEALLAEQGAQGFRRSLEARRACCHVRKVAPLDRALAGASAWITGLRRGQSAARAGTPLAQWDAARGLLKAAPLADWPAERVHDYLARHRVPVNALFAQGYASVGCAPCTRPVAPGEDARAGRWWWEADGPRECGIHMARPARDLQPA